MSENNQSDRTVRDIHREAMRYAQDAYVRLWNAGDSPEVRAMFRKAADLERKAVDRVRNLQNNEPTFSILDLSYRSLDLMAQGRIDDARHLGGEA
jgi:hypothetical protein